MSDAGRETARHLSLLKTSPPQPSAALRNGGGAAGSSAPASVFAGLQQPGFEVPPEAEPSTAELNRMSVQVKERRKEALGSEAITSNFRYLQLRVKSVTIVHN